MRMLYLLKYAKATYNRTIEELKSSNSASETLSQMSYNRTIEELKLGSAIKRNSKAFSYNRTIEELKFRCFCRSKAISRLIIVP